MVALGSSPVCNYMSLKLNYAVKASDEKLAFTRLSYYVSVGLNLHTNLHMPAAYSTFRGSLPGRFLHPVHCQA